ncbi:MAG: hypothetical protein D6772_14715 [Bacteroidetes bacterium]|nr:MAG: hypothetical protein D6772_14715 [Bacteroidota bacterium]
MLTITDSFLACTFSVRQYHLCLWVLILKVKGRGFTPKYPYNGLKSKYHKSDALPDQRMIQSVRQARAVCIKESVSTNTWGNHSLLPGKIETAQMHIRGRKKVF